MTTVGVTRWDAWPKHPQNPQARWLLEPQWQYRLPWYAKRNGEWGEDSPEVINREIELVSAAGFAYWAFDFYRWWWDPDKMVGNYGLRLYLSSHLKDRMRFVLTLLPGQAYVVDEIAEYFREPQYLRVCGNRPLVYSLNAPTAFLSQLKQATNCYLAAMVWDPTQKVRGGADAVSAYSAPERLGYKLLPYWRLATANKKFWNRARLAGSKVIPTIDAGRDSRPRDRENANTYYAQGTPAEIAQNVRNALVWIAQHPTVAEADTALFNALNEYCEGAWLCPTLGEGNARLEAIRTVLGNGG